MKLRWPARTLLLLASAFCALAVFLPLWWVFASSLRPGNTFVDFLAPLSWRAFIPIGGDLSNYQVLLSGSFLTGLGNSFLVAGLTVVLGLAVAVPGAYALARYEFPGRGVLFGFIIVASMIPFDAIAIPLSALFADWGLNDSYAGLILPALANGFAVFVLRQFFLGIPGELLDAAEVDGLGRVGALWRIVLPLSWPALIGAGMMLFLGQWQTYLWPLLIGTSPAHQLAPIALASLHTQWTSNLGAILAGSFVLSIIPMILLLLFQKQYTQSMSTSGLKG
jgi:putative chitobiose transport system permease protein